MVCPNSYMSVTVCTKKNITEIPNSRLHGYSCFLRRGKKNVSKREVGVTHGLHRVSRRSPCVASPRLGESADLRGRHPVSEGPPKPQWSRPASHSEGGSPGTNPSRPASRARKGTHTPRSAPSSTAPRSSQRNHGPRSHVVLPPLGTSTLPLLPGPGSWDFHPTKESKAAGDGEARPEKERDLKDHPSTAKCVSHCPVELSDFNGKGCPRTPSPCHSLFWSHSANIVRKK